MKPLMWERLEADLNDRRDSYAKRSIMTLLAPNSGILPHVRELCIAGEMDTEQADHLGLLIMALPRDKLRSFEADDRLQRTMFLQLLQSQTKLESIIVSTEFTRLGWASNTEIASREHRTWVASLMPEVKSLRLFLDLEDGVAEDNYRNLQSFIDLHPKLEKLKLSTRQQVLAPLYGVLSLAREGRMFHNLTSVELASLSLAPSLSPSGISHNFDVTKLEVLELDCCLSLVPFLDSLSESYVETAGKLRQLSISLPYDIDNQEGTIGSIERLLKVCPGLLDLELELTECNIVDKSCILPHAKMLRSLSIGTAPFEAEDFDQSQYYSTKDLGVILKSCTKLTGLAINLPPINLGCISELGYGFDLNVKQSRNADFADTLVSLFCIESSLGSLLAAIIGGTCQISHASYPPNVQPAHPYVSASIGRRSKSSNGAW
jgi:hypothetical protein